jgi:PAS domain S-box-containing protein
VVDDLEGELERLRQRVSELEVQLERAGSERACASDLLACQPVEREPLLEDALRAAPIGAWTLNLARSTVAWSSELFRILGVDPSVKPSVELFYGLVHAEDRSRVRALWRSPAALDETVTDDFRVVRQSDHKVCHVHAAARPITDESGALVGFIGTLLDVTGRGLLQEQLQQAQRMEALGRLASGVAHDFNNLLTIVTVNADLLFNESPRDELLQIMTAASHAAELTRRLLAFSRKASVAPVALDLNSVIEGVVRLYSRLLGEGVEIELDLSRPLGKIRVDSSQLHQVLLNLVVNARDAMPNGGRLLIRTSSAVLREELVPVSGGAGQGEFVVIEVSDTGVGMDEYTRSRIFEPFFTTKTPGKGTGLGLSTVFGIVRDSGGMIDVVSKPGEGTTFKLYFPLAAGDAVATAARRELAESSERGAST